MGKVVFIIMLSCLSYQATACTCGSMQTFFEGIYKDKFYCIAVYDTTTYEETINNWPAQIGYFQVLDTITSINTEIGKMIVVTGQDGLNCGDNLNYWEKGDTVILGLRGGFYKEFARDTFHLDACSRNFLTIEEGLAEGLNIPEIKQKIVEVISSTDYVYLNQQIELFPNPTNNEVHITSEELEIRSIKIFDIAGRQVAKENWKRKSDSPIDLSNLQQGIYNLLIETDQGRVMRKVVKL